MLEYAYIYIYIPYDYEILRFAFYLAINFVVESQYQNNTNEKAELRNGYSNEKFPFIFRAAYLCCIIYCFQHYLF